MKVLVAVASRHGSTQEIAYFIGKTIKQYGIEADVKNIEDIGDIGGYRGFVVGSAVYGGSWLKPATEFIAEHCGELSVFPTWLFSSGPIGKVPVAEKAVNVQEQMAKTKARQHKLFGGKVDISQLNFPQKAIMYAVSGGQGDYRNWGEIESWAAGIASALKEEIVKKEAKYHEHVQ